MKADILDTAAELQDRMNQAGVEAVRAASKPGQVQNPDGSWPVTECVECGVDLPVERLRHGFVICVDCKQAQEDAARFRRR